MKHLALFVVLVVGGCNKSSSSIQDVSGQFVVESVEIQQPGAILNVSLRNTGTVDLIIPNCNGTLDLGVQRLTGQNWPEVFRADYSMCLSVPIVIRPGERFVKTQGVGVKEQGVYRLILYNFKADATEDIPESLRTSSTFTIE